MGTWWNRTRTLCCTVIAAAVVAASTVAARAEDAAPAPAIAPAATEIKKDSTGTTGAGDSLTTANSYLSGWLTGVATPDKANPQNYTTWTPYAASQPTVDELSKNVAKAFYSINVVWTLVAGFMVMFMQAGFALVETGLCRAKNAAHTMFMNFMVYALGMTGFFATGFALMCGGANGTPVGGPGMLGGLPNLNQMYTVGGYGLFGTTGFFLGKDTYDGMTLVWFLFMMVFMDTTATIPTGALAERWATKHFFLFSLAIGAFIYPIYGCWVWGGGWLAQLGLMHGLSHGFVDYAGSSVVHLQGGALALITCKILGPRIGKFGADGKPRAIPGHHVPMVILGTFILAFGWFGFNAGSSLAGTDGRIAVTAVNTMLASASGALMSVVIMWVFTGKPDPTMACNGMLAGLVAITAPCAFVQPWAAFTIGAFAGGIVIGSVWFVENILKLDDPVGAISVHGVNGAFGVLALGLLADGTYGAGWNGIGYVSYMTDKPGVTGLFYGDSKQFLAQCIGVVVCTGWNVIVGGLIFYILGFITPMRVPPEVEIAGLDLPETGVAGYPEFFTPTLPEQVPASDVQAARIALGM